MFFSEFVNFDNLFCQLISRLQLKCSLKNSELQVRRVNFLSEREQNNEGVQMLDIKASRL